MKRIIMFLLAACLYIGLWGCGSTAEKDAGTENYTPSKTISATFGEVTILDAAFCAKAEVSITESTYSSEITVNGQTTSSSSQTIVTPGYAYADPDGILFAMKTLITNRSDSDVTFLNIPAFIQFADNEPLYLQKGVNFSPVDRGGETLPEGASAEVILVARVPMEEYHSSDYCVLELDGVKVKFPYDAVSIYHSLGYEETDGVPITMDRLLQSLGNDVGTPEDDPAEALSGYYGSNSRAEGKAITISDVSVSFLDALPAKLYAEYSRIGNGDEHILDESQVYAAVHFKITNNTKYEQLLANMNDDFVVDVNYKDGFIFSTDHETDSYYETRAEMTRASGISRFGNPIAVPVLTTVELTIYIPCARVVSTSNDDSLVITFRSGFDGYETFDFVVR